MKNYFFKYLLCIFTSLFALELFFKCFCFGLSVDFNLLRIFVFTLSTSFILAFIFSLFKGIIPKILTLITVFVAGIYTLIMMSFKAFMGNFMSISMLFAGGETSRINGEVSTFISSINPLYYLCLLPFLILLIIFIIKKFNYDKSNTFDIGVRLASIVILILLSRLTLLFDSDSQIKTSKELYNNPSIVDLSLKEFGAQRFLLIDAVHLLKGEEEVIIDVEKKENVITDYSRNIDDTKWNEKISTETDKTILNLHNYYINQEITKKNEYTGMFKDKNLIMIMVESLDMAAINESLTPTLYKMANSSWYFDHYYAPKFSCTTGESEFIALTSIIPSNTVCTPYTYVDNDYSSSIFNLFNESNYISTSYHSMPDKYYPRKQLHANMGSSYYYNSADLNTLIITDPSLQVVGTDWPSDLKLMEESYSKFSDDKYFSFIITATMHFTYESESTIVNKNWDLVKDLDLSTPMKRYYAKAIEFDKSLEYLLNSLKEDNKLDDTVIVIFGDHHPYNLSFSNLTSLSNVSRSGLDEDLMPLIIYNSKLEPKTISKVSSTFDVLPTLANLFDLNYDPRLYIGKDIFDESEGITLFPSGSWVTDKAYYYSSSGEVKVKEGYEITDEYVNEINKIIGDKFTASDQTLKKDYFKYLFKDE